MGKESRLKKAPGETRFSYTNGTRKLSDRNAAPSGTDEDVWSLALYFEQLSEESGFSGARPPVLYTELYHRLSRDSSLKVILDKDPQAVLYSTTSGKGVGGLTIVQDMMEYYFSNYSSNSKPSIDDFCSYETFSSIKAAIVSKYHMQLLTMHGSRTDIPEEPLQPARNPLDKPPALWYPGDQEALEDKLARFREGTS